MKDLQHWITRATDGITLTEFVQEVQRDALEAAAKVCDSQIMAQLKDTANDAYNQASRHAADRIRKLKP